METKDTRKNILIVGEVGHSFDVFDKDMLQNSHKDRQSVEQTMYNVRIFDNVVAYFTY